MSLLPVPLVLHAQEAITLADTVEMNASSSETLQFGLPTVAQSNWRVKEQQVRLSLDARIQSGGLGGYTGGMRVQINEKGLVGRHLLNKMLRANLRIGRVFEWTRRDSNSYILFYSASFSDETKEFMKDKYTYGFMEDSQDPFHFVWDITPYARSGANTLTIRSYGWGGGLRLRDIRVEIGDPTPSPNADPPIAPAPTGPLRTYLPKSAPEMPIVYVSSSGSIRATSGERTFHTRSRTSLPRGKWKEPNEPHQPWTRLRPGGVV